jgi:hypothetical protein
MNCSKPTTRRIIHIKERKIQMKPKRQYRMSNASTVAATATWYCMGESSAPSENDRRDYFPLKSLTFENLSGEAYDLILDPVSAVSGAHTFRVADGQTLTIEATEGITFYNVIAINQGSLTTAANELNLLTRNY